MTNEERIEKFKNEKIAIHCETEEEAKAFVKWCYLNGMTWYNVDFSSDDTFFEHHKCATCYNFRDGGLAYCDKQFYKEKGYEVIKYKDFMKGEKKMTNLEYLVFEKVISESSILCSGAHICKYGVSCKNKECSGCEFNRNVNLCVKTLLQEHKETIKLKRWEYDLIETNDKSWDHKFENFKTYQHMLGKGYFKGVYDTSMTLREILDNCEVVE